MALDPMIQQKKLMKEHVPLLRRKPGENFFVWQAAAREKMKQVLGYPYEKAKDDKFTIEWVKTEDPRFDETRFLFDSEDEITVNCHLLIPKGTEGKIPLVICLQGHSTGMHISLNRPGGFENDKYFLNDDNDFALQAVANGYAALAMDQRGFGERGAKGTPNGVNDLHLMLQAIMMGKSLVGQRCFDVSRAIDIIEAHFPIIDQSRIALMGLSGGGTTTFFAAAVEERIAVSMPACVFTGLFDCYGDMHHCNCCYLQDLMKYFDMGEVAALAAPRPQVIVDGEKDPGFPASGIPKQWEIVKSAYKDAGAEDNVRLVVGPEGHRFYPALSWPVFNEISGWKERG